MNIAIDATPPWARQDLRRRRKVGRQDARCQRPRLLDPVAVDLERHRPRPRRRHPSRSGRRRGAPAAPAPLHHAVAAIEDPQDVVERDVVDALLVNRRHAGRPAADALAPSLIAVLRCSGNRTTCPRRPRTADRRARAGRRAAPAARDPSVARPSAARATRPGRCRARSMRRRRRWPAARARDAPSGWSIAPAVRARECVNTSPPAATATTQPLSTSGGAEKPPVTGTAQRSAPVLRIEARQQLVAGDDDQAVADGGRLRRHDIDRPPERPRSRSMATKRPLLSGTYAVLDRRRRPPPARASSSIVSTGSSTRFSLGVLFAFSAVRRQRVFGSGPVGVAAGGAVVGGLCVVVPEAAASPAAAMPERRVPVRAPARPPVRRRSEAL